jgi:hypothetical protein
MFFQPLSQSNGIECQGECDDQRIAATYLIVAFEAPLGNLRNCATR